MAHFVPAFEEAALLGGWVRQANVGTLAQTPQYPRQSHAGAQTVGVTVDVGRQQKVVPLLDEGPYGY